MNKKNFDRLQNTVQNMVDYVASGSPTPSRQFRYSGKVLVEVKVNGDVVWSLSQAANDLKHVDYARIKSYVDLLSILKEKLGQTDEGMAQILGVPVGSYRNWQAGHRRPSRAAETLLRVALKDPMAVLDAAMSEDRFKFA
jgi:putative transcriptional regulator